MGPFVRWKRKNGMAPSFVSFAASEIDPPKLSQVLADYLAYEQARVFRRLLLKRLGIAAVIASVVAVSVGLLSRPPFWVLIGLLAAAGLHAGALELRARARITRRIADLEALPSSSSP